MCKQFINFYKVEITALLKDFLFKTWRLKLNIFVNGHTCEDFFF